MLQVCTLFSGSSANSTLIQLDGRSVLIDAGGGILKTGKALKQAGTDYSQLDAVFITHEHSDHVCGLATILKKHRIPVIANPATLRKISTENPELDDSLFCEMPTGSMASKGGFEITSFAAPHDSVECVGYRIATKYGNVGVTTDAGCETPEIFAKLSGCEILVLEANHDRNMLLNGPYPYMLKQRIIGPNGHLSNEQSGKLLAKLVETGAKKVLLAHLSKENNTPQAALSTVGECLSARGITIQNDVLVQVAPRDCISTIYIAE